MNKPISSKIVSLIFSILVLTVVVAFYVVAFEEPTVAPPGGDFYPPLNTGSDPQTKNGQLTFSAFYDAEDYLYFVDPASPVSARLGGDVVVGGNLTVGGQNVCLENGTNCPSSGGGWAVPTEIIITTVTHNCNFGGYNDMYNWIQNNGCSGYHVCDSVELTRYSQMGGSVSAPCWFNSGVRGRYPQENPWNDCNGWTGLARGLYWDLNQYPSVADNSLSEFAVCCCRY